MDSGRLDDTPPADLLRRLADAGATGRLRVERDHLDATVWFRDGVIYTASAPEARARLGDRLLGAGRITEEQLHDMLDRQRSEGGTRRIGELLVDSGLVDRDTIVAYVHEQITDSVAALLGWRSGAYAFTPGDQAAEDAPLDVSVENLLMEGARRLQEWEVIRDRLGSLDAVVDFSARDQTAELSLTADEWAMLTRIDGTSTVAEIAQAAGYGQFEAARIIYGLVSAGVVTVVGAPEQPPEPADPSSLFSELYGAVDEPEPRAQPEPEPRAQPEPQPLAQPEPEAEAQPEPETEAQREPETEAGGRSELLREFALLDEEGPKGHEQARKEREQAAPPPARRRIEEPKKPEKGKGGLFGRFRRG